MFPEFDLEMFKSYHISDKDRHILVYWLWHFGTFDQDVFLEIQAPKFVKTQNKSCAGFFCKLSKPTTQVFENTQLEFILVIFSSFNQIRPT